jgi:hypothetical protein
VTKLSLFHRTSAVVLVAVLPVICIAAIAAAPQDRIRTIYVTVLDRTGLPVSGLTSADFTIKEDGQPRTIEQAEPARQPMQIALLLDDGGKSLGATRQAAGEFVERLQGKPSFSLTTTGGIPQRRVAFTGDPREIYGALQKTFANAAPTTQFLDALAESARAFVGSKHAY